MKAFNAYVAGAAEVSVEGGKLKVHRIVAGERSDLRRQPGAGRTPGRRLVRLRALRALLSGVHREGRRIVESNFDTYDSMRIAQMPKVESIIIQSGGSGPWGGIGEPTICVAAPAVMNAYFKATGKRIRSFPLKNHDIAMA